jgi:hypothetical protein
MEKARVAESGIVDGDRGEVKYDVPAGYVDLYGGGWLGLFVLNGITSIKHDSIFRPYEPTKHQMSSTLPIARSCSTTAYGVSTIWPFCICIVVPLRA